MIGPWEWSITRYTGPATLSGVGVRNGVSSVTIDSNGAALFEKPYEVLNWITTSDNRQEHRGFLFGFV